MFVPKEEAANGHRLLQRSGSVGPPKQGHVPAQTNLGTMLTLGDGVPRDDAEAMRWLTRAAKQGDRLAQNKLGVIYSTGRGVRVDLVKAHMWYNLAAFETAKMDFKANWEKLIAAGVTRP